MLHIRKNLEIMSEVNVKVKMTQNGMHHSTIPRGIHTPERALLRPHGHTLIILRKGLLDDAKYQISRLWSLRFQTRRFFKFHLKSIFSLCDIDMQQNGTIIRE